MSKRNEQWLKPYGDTLNDGKMQISFTFPVSNSPKAKKAAEVYLLKLGFKNVMVVSQEPLSDEFTFFIAYVQSDLEIDFSTIQVTEAKYKELSFYEINDLIKKEIGRPLVVVGATIGSDAHTVGLDAILNMKGFNQDYGFERYPEMKTFNMGSQVSPEDLVKKALEVSADVLLVSQTVTQKDAHIRNFTELIEILEVEGLRDRFLILAGGPRISHDLAIELGYDAGFGSGTRPSQVASFIVQRLVSS